MVKLATLRTLLLPAWLARRAFPKAALDAIEAAVAAAEAGHRGEIRVVVELVPPLPALIERRPVRARAEEAFARLRVWDTECNSGVLIYLAWAERQVEVVADRGIATRVPAIAWHGICQDIAQACLAGQPANGLVAAAGAVGDLLRAHFPAGDTANPDELPNRPELE